MQTSWRLDTQLPPNPTYCQYEHTFIIWTVKWKTQILVNLKEAFSAVLLQDRGSAIGKLEPISPVSPVHMDPDLDLVPARFSKEELIQNMDRVDREITMVEQQISKLRKKQVSTAKHPLRTVRGSFLWFVLETVCREMQALLCKTPTYK